MPLQLASLELLFVLVILAPGFFTYVIAKRVGCITQNIDNFDKSIYTLLGSGAATASSVLVLHVVTTLTNTSFLGRPVEEFELSLLSVVYVLTVIVSILYGYIAGYIIQLVVYSGDDVRKDTVWDLVKNNSEEPTRVTIITDSGDEIWGEVYVSNSDHEGQDIFLRYPLRKIRDENGTVIDKKNLGDYSFISKDTISQMYFEKEVEI